MLVIPSDFDPRLASVSRELNVQIITDGSQPNMANFAANYARGIYQAWLATRNAGEAVAISLEGLIDRRKVLLGLSVPLDFSRKINSGHSAKVQLLLDGRRANAAQVASSYVASIASAYNSELLPDTLHTGIDVRHWFNPNLWYAWFIVPSLSGVLALLIAMLVTALSIARERELGTFEQLLVSPISATEIIIGKSFPAVLIGAVLGMVMVLAGVLIFRVPFSGNPVLLAITLPLFILSGVGIGLSVSFAVAFVRSKLE